MLRRLLLSLAALTLWTGVATAQVVINEIRTDQPSTDNDEYFELAGTAGTSLDGLTYVVIGDGSGAAASGVIENTTDLMGLSITASGFFVAAEATFTAGTADFTTTLDFENSDNTTHLLVQGFTGANGDDLDTDDDGVLDVMPWAMIVDSVALIETDPMVAGEQVYSTTQVGPDGTFAPGHVYRCPDGTGGIWTIGVFDPVGTTDTPGGANSCGAVCAPPTGFDCDSDCGTNTISLDWNIPAVSTYTQIEVFRDGMLLATLPGTDTTYDDVPLPTGVTYTYELVVACDPMGTASVTCAVDHCFCQPPTGISCVSDCVSNDVNISWTNGDLYTSIEIRRDGALVGTLGGMDTTFTDPALAPGIYAYEVLGICAPGDTAAANCGIAHCLPIPALDFNEMRVNTPGADDDEEFIEITGAAGTSLDGVTFLVIGDGAGGDGVIEEAIDLTGLTVDSAGFFVIAQSDLDDQTDPLLATACINYMGAGMGPDLIAPDINLENSDNVTYLLVAGFTGLGGDDLDTNDDGALDILPWNAIVAEIGLVDDPNGGNFIYSTTTVGPSPFGQPDHAFRCIGGLGGQNEWRIGSLFGCPSIDTPGTDNTQCPTCFEILDLVCTSDCVTGNISFTWTNDDVYTEILVLRDGLQVDLLMGTDTSYTDLAVAGGLYTYEFIAVCGMGNDTTTTCDVIHGVYNGEDNVIFVGEMTGGAVDSVALLESALLGNGETVIRIDQLEGYGCFDQFTADETILWVMNGTFPFRYQMTMGDGQALVDLVTDGVAVYVEGAGTFDFDPATPFLDYDGVDNSISMPGVGNGGDDSLTSIDGAAFDNLDLSALQDIVYTEDRPMASDFNGPLLPTGTTAPLDTPGGSAGIVWANNPDMLPDPMAMETNYGVAIYYKNPGNFGDVIASSIEFGGINTDQVQLAALYANALRRDGTMMGDQFMRGDCNNDNNFNIADAVTTLGFLFPAPGTPPPTLACDDACDANDDGALNIADAVTKLGNLFPSGPPTPLPAPFMTCGVDPTMDGQGCAAYSHCP